MIHCKVMGPLLDFWNSLYCILSLWHFSPSNSTHWWNFSFIWKEPNFSRLWLLQNIWNFLWWQNFRGSLHIGEFNLKILHSCPFHRKMTAFLDGNCFLFQKYQVYPSKSNIMISLKIYIFQLKHRYYMKRRPRKKDL